MATTVKNPSVNHLQNKDSKSKASKKPKGKEAYQQQLNDAQKKNIKEAFDLFDTDGSGINNKKSANYQVLLMLKN